MINGLWNDKSTSYNPHIPADVGYSIHHRLTLVTQSRTHSLLPADLCDTDLSGICRDILISFVIRRGPGCLKDSISTQQCSLIPIDTHGRYIDSGK